MNNNKSKKPRATVASIQWRQYSGVTETKAENENSDIFYLKLMDEMY